MTENAKQVIKKGRLTKFMECDQCAKKSTPPTYLVRSKMEFVKKKTTIEQNRAKRE